MTTYKIKKEITLTKPIKEIPDVDWDKLAIQSSWDDIKTWFWDNRNNFFADEGRFGIYLRTACVSDLMSLMNIDPTIIILWNGQRLWKTLSSALTISQGNFELVPTLEDRFNEIWNPIRDGNKLFKSDWTFTPEGLRFFKKYLGDSKVNAKASAGSVLSEELIKSEIDKGNITKDQVESSDAKPVENKPTPEKTDKSKETLTQDFKNECDRILKAWTNLINSGYSGDDKFDALNDRVLKGKDAILNDPFLKSFSTRTEEEQRYFFNIIRPNFNYSSDTNSPYKHIWWIKEVSYLKTYSGRLIYWMYEFQRVFLEQIDPDKWTTPEQLAIAQEAQKKAETDLKTWTDAFGTLKPSEIIQEKQKPEGLPTDWKEQIAKKTEWETTFAGKSAEDVKNELDSLNYDLEDLRERLSAYEEGKTRALFEVTPK